MAKALLLRTVSSCKILLFATMHKSIVLFSGAFTGDKLMAYELLAQW